ncbi:MAG: DMT family transporter [Candidatus Wallbacteria bacterium]|nr:DMT family transporter [Candidatus Wallbacteria bacterium]
MGASSRVGVLCCLGAAVVWSSGGLFIKLVDLPAVEIAGLRGLLSAFFFATLALASRTRAVEAGRARWTPAAVAGAVSAAFTFLFFVVATKWTTAAAAIFLQSTAPAWVLALGWAVLGLAPGPRDAAALAGCSAGLSLFFFGRLTGASFWGNVAALASGCAFGIHMLAMRQVSASLRLAVLAAGNALAAALALGFAVTGAAAVLVREPRVFAWPNAGQWLYLAYLGVGQIGLGYYLFVLAIQRIPSLQASLLVLLEPVLNPVWVYLGTGEAPGAWACAGGALVLATLAWHTGSSPRSPGQREAADSRD